MAKLVEKTYADALFKLALDTNSIDVLFEEGKAIVQILEENEDLLKLLRHPKIKKEEKISVIENVFKNRVSDDMTGFLVLTIEKERHNELVGILEEFISITKEHKRIGIAYVTTAIELDDARKKEIEQKLINTTNYVQFEMHYSVDKDIIGGMIIRIKDRVVDSSIKSKIENMSKDLYNIQLA
ncbi:MAG: ATP synthase F1 subunit delta [Lachnospiraceae bacterium]|nr:ATP synthase F1 subunit delta [Lachnospiraceae bacterium]